MSPTEVHKDSRVPARYIVADQTAGLTLEPLEGLKSNAAEESLGCARRPVRMPERSQINRACRHNVSTSQLRVAAPRRCWKYNTQLPENTKHTTYFIIMFGP